MVRDAFATSQTVRFCSLSYRRHSKTFAAPSGTCFPIVCRTWMSLRMRMGCRLPLRLPSLRKTNSGWRSGARYIDTTPRYFSRLTLRYWSHWSISPLEMRPVRARSTFTVELVYSPFRCCDAFGECRRWNVFPAPCVSRVGIWRTQDSMRRPLF